MAVTDPFWVPHPPNMAVGWLVGLVGWSVRGAPKRALLHHVTVVVLLQLRQLLLQLSLARGREDLIAVGPVLPSRRLGRRKVRLGSL